MNSEETYRPFVSIAMTTYNSGKYMKQQVDSLLNQTYTNFELVVSDDMSKDDTTALLDEYVKADPRVRWSSNPHPAGCAKNFERVISLCKGEIIFLCDSDDTWYPEKLELHVKEYRDRSVGWVYNRSVLTDIYNNEIGYIEDTAPDYFTHKRSMLENAWGSCIGGAHASFRASTIKGALPFDHNAGSHDAWLQIVAYPAKSVFINKVLQTYRQHATNDSGWLTSQKPRTGQAFKDRENLAIANNLRLIKGLPFNPRLPLWKRFAFLVVYIGKVTRLALKGNR